MIERTHSYKPVYFLLAPLAVIVLDGMNPAQAQRILGLDVSAWQGNLSQTTWNNIRNVENRQFVFIRSSRGGTTGYDHRQGGYPSNNNTAFTLSNRYDDPYFVQNIHRATTAGLFAGPYHFSRPDIIASYPNSGGIPNSAVDEANHFMEMAGAWMRPGYLVPVHDFEAGDGARTDVEMAQYALDFSNRIYEVMQIRPAIYINGNYAEYVLGGGTAAQRAALAQQSSNPPSVVSPAYPTLWSARWPNQNNPDAIDVQNSEPKDSVSYIYGPWDDYGVTHPWAFWQYTSRGRLQSYNNGQSNLDFNVSRGDIEFLKDYLVPAVWWHDNSGDWSALANWNSGQPANPPVQAPSCGSCSSGTGQLAPAATGPLPVPRLPGEVGSGPAVTSGHNDTVILERPNAEITVTLSTGSYAIRKLFMRESLVISGGSLTINYDPHHRFLTDPNNNYPNSQHSGPISAQFSGPVTLSDTGTLNVHTLQVDSTRTFTLAGGTLSFNTIYLMPHASNPARIAVTGDVTINPLIHSNPFVPLTATIANGSGSGAGGLIDLNGGNRSFIVGDGPASIDLDINVPITNGALTKSGGGTMRLGASNTYTGQTTLYDGILLVTGSSQLGTTGVVTGQSGTLQLTGNLNYSLPLTIGGAGFGGVSLTPPGNRGALSNLSGDSIWSGLITLAGTASGGTSPLLNQIGVQAGSLRLSNVIQDASGVNASWAKTGSGDLIISGPAPNTYTGLTRLFGGRLILEKDGALGAAGAIGSATGNTFQLADSASTLAFRAPTGSDGFDYNTFEVINTHGTGAPGFGQVDNLGGDNTFAGLIAFAGPTSGGAQLASIGVSSGSLHLTGGLYARGNDGLPRHITKLGAGKLILSGNSAINTGNPLVVPLASSTVYVSAGTVEMRGPSDTTTNLPGVSTWNVSGGAALNAVSGLFATNLVTVHAGGQFNLSGGAAAIGTLNLADGGTFNCTGGRLHVDYVEGDLLNQGGLVAPGTSPSVTEINGNYTQLSGAGLEIKLGGPNAISDHDYVLISGSAILGGSLQVSLINGFSPTPGQQFTILDATNIVNNGLSLDGPAADLFNLIVGASSVILEAINAGVPGDFNGDGFVDSADYVVWRKSPGTAEGYQAWLANFGYPPDEGTAAATHSVVPEPTAATLLGMACAIIPLAVRRAARFRVSDSSSVTNS